MRRALAVVVAALSLLVPASPVTSGDAAAAGSYDAGVTQAECDLVGRVFVRGSGCSRTQCVRGAKLYRRTYGAEACRLRDEPAIGFVSTIESRRCTALGRRWIGSVNYCATYPDRSATAVYDAPQCPGNRSVFVPISDEEGYYDECLTPLRVRELQLLATIEGSTLAAEAAERSQVQCAWRPEHVYSNGRCVPAPGTRPARGGVVVIGDSLTWRGNDELVRLRPAFSVDGEPARRLSALQARIAAYKALRGVPTGVIVALGTVPPPRSFRQRDLARIVGRLPRDTRVMLVLPYAENSPGRPTASTVEVVGWMRAIARARSRTCLADWPSYVRAHRGILADGVHLKRANEKAWAGFMSNAWSRC